MNLTHTFYHLINDFPTLHSILVHIGVHQNLWKGLMHVHKIKVMKHNEHVRKWEHETSFQYYNWMFFQCLTWVERKVTLGTTSLLNIIDQLFFLPTLHPFTHPPPNIKLVSHDGQVKLQNSKVTFNNYCKLIFTSDSITSDIIFLSI